MPNITCEQEIEKTHEIVDNNFKEALKHFNTNNVDPYINKNNIKFKSFEDYINDNDISFKYIPPEANTNDISVSTTGYWRFQIGWGGPSYEYRFYMNEPLAFNPIAIQFWFTTWLDNAYRDDIRGIGQEIWDHLAENRVERIEYTAQ